MTTQVSSSVFSTTALANVNLTQSTIGNIQAVQVGNVGTTHTGTNYYIIGTATAGNVQAVQVGNVGTTLTGTNYYIIGTATAGNVQAVVVGNISTTYYGSASTIGNITPIASNVGNIGSSALWYSNIFAKTFVGTATTATYADLAENYLADAAYPPGTVVEFGGIAEVTKSQSDMGSRVAGVVSTNPAYLMNSSVIGEYVVPVALQGRVPCFVYGPVRKGDMMVSAGYGRARAENIPQVGTVIGKSLEDFNGDQGTIEVVVGRN